MSSPLPENPYEILGVSKDAQLPEIRSAHRKRVLKCHPDKVQDPALKAEKQNEFQRVQQAYELLSDENEREKYDNQVRITELRKQAAAQNKANSSATRSSRSAAPEFEVHYASPRPAHRSSPSTAAPPTFTKVYYSSRSYSDEERRSGPRVFDAEPRVAPVRRESSYVERETRPSKRETEREREREKDRDRERDRERRKKAADREAKEAKETKEAKREQKRLREKQLAKEQKRQAEEKRRYMTPPEDDAPAPPRMDKKSSSSRKYETREPPMEPERDLGYNDFEVDAKARFHEEYAQSYINAARVKAGGAPRRAKTYHGRTPYVPSPPPPTGAASAYPSPDEDEPRRSAATSRRRGSADAPKLPREKSYSKPSRERLDEEPVGMESRTPGMQKSASSVNPAAGLSSSPPHPLPRTNTMPTEATFSRPVPGVTRAQTFTEGASPRGRTRSKMEPQVEIDSEEEDVYDQERERERRARERDARDARGDRKHRSSKKHRSPERYREEPRATHTYTYSLNEEGGAPRTKLSRSYTRRLDPDSDVYDPYGSGARYVERPPLGARESSYSSTYGAPPPMSKFPKIRTTKLDDVQYSKYPSTYVA